MGHGFHAPWLDPQNLEDGIYAAVTAPQRVRTLAPVNVTLSVRNVAGECDYTLVETRWLDRSGAVIEKSEHAHSLPSHKAYFQRLWDGDDAANQKGPDAGRLSPLPTGGLSALFQVGADPFFEHFVIDPSLPHLKDASSRYLASSVEVDLRDKQGIRTIIRPIRIRLAPSLPTANHPINMDQSPATAAAAATPPCSDGSPRCWFAGDQHVHTVYSLDSFLGHPSLVPSFGTGTVTEYAHAARNQAGLDWMIVTDHANVSAAVVYNDGGQTHFYRELDFVLGTNEARNVTTDPSFEFVALYSEELAVVQDSVTRVPAHYLAYPYSVENLGFIENPVQGPSVSCPVPLEGYDLVDVSYLPTLSQTDEAIIQEVNTRGGMGFIAHPFAFDDGWVSTLFERLCDRSLPPFYQTWSQARWGVPGYAGLEIWSNHAGLFKDTDSRARSYWYYLLRNLDPPETRLNQGFPNAFPVGIGNSDAHTRSDVGNVFTYCWMNGLSWQNITEALMRGHCVASNGPLGYVTIDGKWPGETVVLPGTATSVAMTAHVRLTSEFNGPFTGVRNFELDILVNGHIRDTISFASNPHLLYNLTHAVNLPLREGDTFVTTHLRSLAVQGLSFAPRWLAVANPIWLEFDTTCHESLGTTLESSRLEGCPPFSVNLSADATGTAIGTASYTFWWNCPDVGTSVDQVKRNPLCGDPEVDPTVGEKFNHVSLTSMTVNHTYGPGTHTAKVIVERGCADPVTDHVTITVTGCDDGKPCTGDVCLAGVCHHTSNSGWCNDDNPCTINDQCTNGVCTGTPTNCDLTPPIVSIQDPCSGTCPQSPISVGGLATDEQGGSGLRYVYVKNETNGDDGFDWNVSGTAALYEVPGILLTPGVNRIYAQAFDQAGNPGNQYFVEVAYYPPPCDGRSGDTDGDGVCGDVDDCPGTPSGHEVDANGCACHQADDDRDGVHNCNDLCPDTVAGQSVGPDGCPSPECVSAADCDDTNPCTDEACVAGVCHHTNNTASCEHMDLYLCTRNDTCSNGTCRPGSQPVQCEAGHACDPSTGECVNTTSLSVSILTPSDGQVFLPDNSFGHPPTVLVSGTARDSEDPSGVTMVEVQVNNWGWSPASGTTDWYLFRSLGLGDNTIQARSRNSVGLTSPVHSIAVTYDPDAKDTHPPIVTITNPSEGAEISAAQIDVSVMASDPRSPSSNVRRVQARVNCGDCFGGWQPASGTAIRAWNRRLTLCPGTNTIQARSYDWAGNVSPLASVTVQCTGCDTDGDGDPDVTDCNPFDPMIHRGAAEICDDNGFDNDCDSFPDCTDSECAGSLGCPVSGSTGWHSPTATGRTKNEWTNGVHGLSSDDSYTTAQGAFVDQDYTDFNFNVPPHATIHSIHVSVEGHGTTGCNDQLLVELLNDTRGDSVWLTLGDGADVIALGAGLGSIWTPSALSNDEFILRINTATNVNPIFVDHVRANVHYSECADASDCDDDTYCNGQETCLNGICQPGVPPDCDDEFPCTIDSCNEETESCINAAVPNCCVIDAHCSDARFCNGVELCLGNTCQPGTDPCAGGLCDEARERCVECLGNVHCDDGVFCNGAETCVDGACHSTTAPCSPELCHEDSDTCDVENACVGPDSDLDGFRDLCDNCTYANNPDQRDTDQDGFGSACDTDLNNDCATDSDDYGMFLAQFGGAEPNSDLNGDGVAGIPDLLILMNLLGQPPGPSEIAFCP